jgi:short-subunit dehydrogenase
MNLQKGTSQRARRNTGAITLFALAAGGPIAAGRSRARSRRALDLTGKRVLVTGASRGLGLILARRLAECGARVALAGRREESLERACASIRASCPSATVAAVTGDISDTTQAERIVAHAETALGGPVEILINNAGIITVGPVETMTDADFAQAMQTHVWGPWALIQAVLPSMRARGAGRIVNVASIGGRVAVPHLLPYSTSKFALVGLSEGLRAERVKDGIYVTTVCPGLIRTGSPRNAGFKGQHRKEYAWFALSDSLPGISMSAESCAAQIIDALRHGDAEIVTSLVAQVAALAHGVAPGLVTDILGQINRLLPVADSAQSARFSGAESESALTRSPLTTLTRRAEAANNQLG